MRIGLNLLAARPAAGGVWNYVERLLEALAGARLPHDFVAFVTDQSAPLVPHESAFRTIKVPLAGHGRLGSIVAENTILPRLARAHRLDCLHWFAYTCGMVNAVPALVSVPDARQSPFLRIGAARRLWYDRMMRKTARRARILLPMSRYTGRELVEVYGVEEARVKILLPILDSGFRVRPEDEIARLREAHGLPARFWLYVAQFYDHKNHLRLLEAYGRLRRARSDAWPLVLRGDESPGTGPIRDRISRLGLERSVILLRRLPRNDMPVLYSGAAAVVFPSLFEGGGLPVIEAMACGCPLLASRIPAVQEYAGDAARYVNALDIGELCDGMSALQDELNASGRRPEAGVIRARAFRPEAVVEQLASVYASLN